MGLGVARHPLPVLIGWIVVIIAMVLLVARIGALTTNDLTLPGTDSQKATDLLAGQVPAPAERQEPDRLPRHLREDRQRREQDRHRERREGPRRSTPTSSARPSPFGQNGASQIAKDNTTAFIPVLLDINSADLTTDGGAGDPRPRRARRPGHRAWRSPRAAPIGSELSKPETESSELVGIVAAMIILSFAFGTLVAMGMPDRHGRRRPHRGAHGHRPDGPRRRHPRHRPHPRHHDRAGRRDRLLALPRQPASPPARRGHGDARVDRDHRRHLRRGGRLRRRHRRHRPRRAGRRRHPAGHRPRLRVGGRRPHRGAGGDHAAARHARAARAPHRRPAPPHLAAPAHQGPPGPGLWAAWGRTVTRHPLHRDRRLGRRARRSWRSRSSR